jgi:penicillin-binding protein 1A
MGIFSGKRFFSALVVRLVAFITIVIVVIIGIGLGWSLAMTANIKNQENFIELAPALPTRILDINGTLITEFASDEKRELVSLSELPRHLIHAVLAREDPDFYNHRGFSVRGTSRALLGQLTGVNLGGGSTITQQVAGTLYTNRRERTYRRKVRELWWAFQLERRYTKNEILEIYLNYMPMGPGTYGVETASKYFFGHSARDVDLAEAAVLAVLLSGPTRFDPLRNPSLAMDRQHAVLERMIQFGYADKDEAEASYARYWENFDWTRPSLAAYLTREDKAPWFSEYVRRELDSLMYGTMDYYRDGYVVHTTLNLAHQEAAEKFMAEGLERANREYAWISRRGNVDGERRFRPILNLLTLAFNITDIRTTSVNQNELRAISRFTNTLNPVVDLAALAFGISDLKYLTSYGYAQMRERAQQNVVEGALVAIENETGYITAIVGGSKFDQSNQYIRASQASVQTGSAFKPLYYSAAIDTRRITAATMLYDMPVVFFSPGNEIYVPNNYSGEWRGSILTAYALALSLNIPSLQILETIGFTPAINRSVALLGITDEATIRRQFPRVYPLGLGTTATSPLRMARAFAIFANQGRDVTPIAIRSVEDRNGRVVFDVERDVRQRQQRMENNAQVISPQNAYIMIRMGMFATSMGTMAGADRGRFNYTDSNGRSFRMPISGKTGTTQNWADAWTIGSTPYYTTAVWFGFDRPGNSLGISQSGAALAAPVWGDVMREINRGLPQRNFVRPSGVYDATVCRISGKTRTANCNEGAVTLPFLVGTGPGGTCEVHRDASPHGTRIPVNPLFSINDSFLDDILAPLPQISPEFQERTPSGANQNIGITTQQDLDLSSNPFMNDNFSDNVPSTSERTTVNESPPPDSIPVSEPNTNPVREPAIVPRNEDEASADNSDLPSWNPLD